MTTKRRKIGPRLINQQTPAWVVRLLNENVAPRAGEPGADEWFGWMFCDERVPGLPQSDTPEGNAIWLRASDRLWDATWARATEPRNNSGRRRSDRR
jgi:hypothetical protein